jgi:creatinine amidohydrolase/Fe(II)-dependent formamide hydrolase-like protein
MSLPPKLFRPRAGARSSVSSGPAAAPARHAGTRPALTQLRPTARGRRACRALAALAAVLVGAGAHGAPDPGSAARSAAAAPVFLEDLTWTELRDAVTRGRTTALVPVGGTEQSGPALALGKHNARVRLLAGRIAGELGNAIVAPVMAYVPEGSIEPPSSHMRFPGTLSLPPAVFEASLQSIARSLRAAGFRDIVFLGDHGGYQTQLAQAAAHLNREWAAGGTRAYSGAAYYRAATEGYARILREHGFRDDEIGTHAALADTSLQMAAAPDMVRAEVLRAGRDLDSAHGVYGGDPRRASAELGQLGLDEIVRQSVAAIRSDIAAARRGTTRSP